MSIGDWIAYYRWRSKRIICKVLGHKTERITFKYGTWLECRRCEQEVEG